MRGRNTIGEKIVTAEQVKHVAVSYMYRPKNLFVFVTRTYAIDEGLLAKAQLWSNLREDPDALSFKKWLEANGCKPISEIERYFDDSTREKYFCDGKLHRQNGPAVVWRSANGTPTKQEYFRHGLRINPTVPLSNISGIKVVQHPSPA
jgi:hypothetical protein